MTLERGTLLHKRYRIVEILGQGGMGSVYRSVDENLGVDVALKENLFTTDEYARQFRLEAVILANLRHPNLPRVSDHFVVGEQGQYLVMDFIDGEDLRQRMERVGTIAEEEAIMIGAAMCDALTYLHTRKPPILHRDIKPGNVKITPDGHIFLVDFGLAKVVQGTQATTTGARAMTPGYSPPEQYGTARTDPRTDVYSLGSTLYASLTGIIPEDGLARAMDNAQLTPLRKRNSKVSRRLAAAIEQSMAVDPADRFQTAEEFKRALLGSKSKTQRVAGNYTIPPPPADMEPPSDDFDDDDLPKKPVEKKPGLMAYEPENEFKPPKIKKKRRGCALPLLLILLLLVAGLGGVSYFYPNLVPASFSGYIPWIVPSPTTLLTTTQTLPPTETLSPEPSPTFTLTAELPSPTPQPTYTSTPTFLPTDGPSLTPTNTLIPSPTPIGGGYGQVAFASNRTGVPQIYLINAADGSEIHPITNLPEGACQPSWSPDGARVVFTSPCMFKTDSYRESSLYIVNADGTELTPLNTAPGGDFDPAWSPDGKSIAFTSLRDGRKEIYLLDLATSDVTRMTSADTDEENSQPAWSPFGNQIAFVKKRFDVLQIWTMTDTGQNPEQVVRSGQTYWDFYPVWSPDAQYILFNQRQINTGGLPWMMQIRYEDRETQTASRLKLGIIGIENLNFSQDGFWMACEGVDDRDNRDIYYMTASGATRTRLTTDPDDDFDPAWRPITKP
ncbi:MAG: protein kinase [Anaerolineales bacterium]|jgi:Tol biopolymer transport system component